MSLLNYPITGHSVVEASAGTGKTYTLSYLFLRFLLEKNLEVDQILVVTFTEAATQELHGRIRQQLKSALRIVNGQAHDLPEKEVFQLQAIIHSCKTDAKVKLQKALQSIDEAHISTIHSFCQWTLKSYAFQSGLSFGADLLSNQDDLIESVVQDFWRKHLYRESQEMISYALSKAKLTIPKLIKMVKKKLGNPYVIVEPIIQDKPASVHELYVEWTDSYQRLKSAWDQDKERLIGLLKPDAHGVKTAILGLKSYFYWAKPGMELNTKQFAKFTKASPDCNFSREVKPFIDIFKTLNAAFEEHLLWLYNQLLTEVEERLQKVKLSSNVLSFSDLLVQLHNALLGPNGEVLAEILHTRFPAALIDEFQDTDPVQFKIFDAIYASAPPESVVYLIGDPKQSIYRFRGADIYTYAQATQNKEHQRLDTNWRSQKGVLDAIETLFKNVENPFQAGNSNLPKIDFQSVQFAPEVQNNALTISGKPFPAMPLWRIGEKGTPVDNVRSEIATKVSSEIALLLIQGQSGSLCIGQDPVNAKDITVLVRKNAEAQLIQEALSLLNIPTVVYSQENIFDSVMASDLQSVLEAVENPLDNPLKVALTSDLMGLNASDLFDLTQNESEWEDTINAFRTYRHLWLTEGFSSFWEKFLDQKDIFTHLGSFEDGRKRQAQLRQLTQLLYEQNIQTNMGLMGMIHWLKMQRVNPDPQADNQMTSLETDQNAVKIMTIHRSKGLEFPIVFCPFLWGASIPKGFPVDYYDKERRRLILSIEIEDKKIKPAKEKRKSQLMAEDIRLVYVALTRAKHACYVVWHTEKANWRSEKCKWSALGFLLDFADKVMESREEIEAFQNLSEISGNSLQFLNPPTEGTPFSAPTPPELAIKNIKNSAHSSWRISSYSALSQSSQENYSAAKKDHDENEDQSSPLLDLEPQEALDIFHFPRGSQMGIFIHHLFEHLPFDSNRNACEQFLLEKCMAFNIDQKWMPALTDMLHQTLNIPLGPEKALLSQLPPEKLRIEMEFIFPMNRITPRGLSQVFKSHGVKINPLSFYAVEGLLKGFIDLLFEHQGRYYVLDYKSNHLGFKMSDYACEELSEKMVSAQYTLQYHLYTVALHRFLKLSLPAYDYDAHMGGSLYLFLRGMNPEDPKNGVYFDRPSKALILALSQYLGQEPPHGNLD